MPDTADIFLLWHEPLDLLGGFLLACSNRLVDTRPADLYLDTADLLAVLLADLLPLDRDSLFGSKMLLCLIIHALLAVEEEVDAR